MVASFEEGAHAKPETPHQAARHRPQFVVCSMQHFAPAKAGETCQLTTLIGDFSTTTITSERPTAAK